MQHGYDLTLKVRVAGAMPFDDSPTESQKAEWVNEGIELARLFVDTFVGDQYRELGGAFDITHIDGEYVEVPTEAVA